VSGTVLVTGSSGFIGRHLVPALLAGGFSVRVAQRRPQSRTDFGSGVTAVTTGDLTDETDWAPALREVKAVVHLAGLAHTGGGIPAATFDRVNRWATVRLAAAARDAGARFVFMSSVRAQTGATAAGTLTEASPAMPTDAYGRSKLAAEREIAALGGRFVILRPTLVYGRGVGGNMRSLARLSRLPIPLPFGAIRNARSLLAVENLARAVLLALTNEAALGGTYLVADAAPVSLAEIISFLRKGHGRGAGLIPVPPALVGGALTLLGQRAMWERLSGSLVVSTARLSAIGYRPAVPTETALAALGAS
jgi:nucleoside-diphosphate-sugar epimerase